MTVTRPGQTARMRRVMLVDDHALVRRGLRALIESASGWAVCAEASDGREALRIAASARPNIVVMDLSMPGLGGGDATMQLKRILPDVEVLILTMHESDLLAGQVLRAGARGYLLKNESEGKLIDALEALSRHQPYFSPTVLETLLRGYLTTEPETDLKQLTARERHIAKLVAEGQSNKRIAAILELSIKTVEAHRAAAMHKIGAKSAAELTLYAARNDLVQI